MDGTMIDNMMVHHRAWQKQLASLGLEMSLAEVQEKIHGVNHEILERLFGDRFTPAERLQIAKAKEAAYREIYLPDLQLIKGLPAFLEEIHQAGIPMAIGTAAPPENAHFVLDNLDLRHYFKGIFHSDSVKKGKPDPEIFQLAAASMGLQPSDCIVFEDSVAGAATAQNAGSPSIIITTTHQAEEFAAFSNILQFIKDYQTIRLSNVQALFRNQVIEL